MLELTVTMDDDTSLVWRLEKNHDRAECRVALASAQGQGYTVTVEHGGQRASSDVASDWASARKLIVERRDRMLTEGWTQIFP